MFLEVVFPLKNALTFLFISPNCPWNLPNLTQACLRNLLNMARTLPPNLPKVSQQLPKTFQTSPQNFPNVFKRICLFFLHFFTWEWTIWVFSVSKTDSTQQNFSMISNIGDRRSSSICWIYNSRETFQICRKNWKSPGKLKETNDFVISAVMCSLWFHLFS